MRTTFFSRDRLIDELWGEQAARDRSAEPAGVRLAVAQAVCRPGTLLTRPPGYLLEVEPAELDLHCFERLVGEGRAALAEGDPARAATALHNGLGLWRGPALADLAFEPFAQAEIGRLDSLRLAAVEERIEADLALGRHADLIVGARGTGRRGIPTGSGCVASSCSRSTDLADRPRRSRATETHAESSSRSSASSPGAALQRLEKSDPRPGQPPRHSGVRTSERERVAIGGNASWSPSSSPTWGWRTSSTTIPSATRGVSRRGPPRGTGRDRSGRRHGRGGIAGALIATFGAPHAREEDHALPCSQRRPRHPQSG